MVSRQGPFATPLTHRQRLYVTKTFSIFQAHSISKLMEAEAFQKNYKRSMELMKFNVIILNEIILDSQEHLIEKHYSIKTKMKRKQKYNMSSDQIQDK